MPATRVRLVAGDGRSVGSRLEAVTGAGPASFVDPMRITEWVPHVRCVVEHTGRVVRGEGVFEVVGLPDGGSRVVWTEKLDLPFGRAGRLASPVVRPVAEAALTIALRRLARAARR